MNTDELQKALAPKPGETRKMRKHDHCSSYDHEYRRAVGIIPHPRRISATEINVSEIAACDECLTEWNRQFTEPEPFSKDWHMENVDRLAVSMRRSIADWFEGGRDNPAEVRRLYGNMLCDSRALAAELGGIALLDHQEENRRHD